LHQQKAFSQVFLREKKKLVGSANLLGGFLYIMAKWFKKNFLNKSRFSASNE